MIEELIKNLEEESEKIIQNRLLSWSTKFNQFEFKGIALKPLNFSAWIDLRIIKNTLLCEGEINNDAFMEYIWRCSENYSPLKNRKSKKEKIKIGFIFEKFTDEAVEMVFDHLDFAFQELADSKNSNKSSSYENKTIKDVDHMILAIDEVAARYGQNPMDLFEWPISQVLQFQKALRIATIPDYKLQEPSKIRNIKSQILTEINNGNNS